MHRNGITRCPCQVWNLPECLQKGQSTSAYLHGVGSYINQSCFINLGLFSSSEHVCHICSKGEFVTKVTIIKEQLASRENEVNGKWLTEERMRKNTQDFSTASIRSIVAYCSRFPETLVRLDGGKVYI